MAKSRKLPPLTLAEAHTPGHEGMMRFLEVSPDDFRHRMVARGVAKVSPGTPNAHLFIDPLSTPGEAASPVVTDTPVVLDTPGVLDGEVRRKVTLRVRECRAVQDGHSVVEQSIYDAMYRHGKAKIEADGSRTVSLGYADLVYSVRISRRTVKLNVRSLLAKQSIEVCGDFSAIDSAPKTYRVLSYTTIIERRKSKGMDHVIRQNGGVRFVSAEGRELVPTEVSLPGPVLVPEPPRVEESFSLASMLIDIDMDTAARRDLIAACRAESPTVRIEEIARVVSEMAQRDAGKARNLVGYLLTVVPRQFESRGLELSRTRWAAEDAEGKRQIEKRERVDTESRAFVDAHVIRLRKIIDDPKASQADRDEAAKTLKQIGK